MPRAEYGIALGWKLQTPGAIKVYIPHRKFIAVRNTRSLKVIESIPPEWKWTPQIPARSHSIISSLPESTLHMSAPNEPIQTAPPDYEEQDLSLPRFAQEGDEPEFSPHSLPQEGDISIEPAYDQELSKTASEAIPDIEKPNEELDPLIQEHVHGSFEEETDGSERLTIKISKELWEKVMMNRKACCTYQ